MHTRRDANHQEIVNALRSAHIDVIDVADVPANLPELADLPDIIAGGYHQTYGIPYTILIEIKTPMGEFRKGQQEIQRWWRGAIGSARTPAEALALFGIISD